MSFILDALKKSEIERQRQSVPGLMDTRSSPRRNRLPVWAVALCVLLGINLLVLTFVALFVRAMTGLGALIMAGGLNMCFFLAPPAATATYAIAVATWYLGLFILVQPWTRTQAAIAVPAPR